MKKILSLGVASAVLSLTAVAASAAIYPEFANTPIEGNAAVVEIVASEFTDVATQFVVEASDNMTLDSYEVIGSGLAAFNADTMHFAWAGTEAPEEGAVLLALVFNVDAAADEEVSVSIVPDSGFESGIDADAVSITVVADATDEDDLFDESSEEPIDESTEDSGLVDGGTVDTADADAADDTNPNTGIALAVVPAVLAGAAVVVAKKRK